MMHGPLPTFEIQKTPHRLRIFLMSFEHHLSRSDKRGVEALFCKNIQQFRLLKKKYQRKVQNFKESENTKKLATELLREDTIERVQIPGPLRDEVGNNYNL